MHIAVCGPISLQLLSDYVSEGETLPRGYACPLIAFICREYLRKGHSLTVVTSTTDVEAEKQWCGDTCRIVATPRRKKARLLMMDFYRCEVGVMRQALLRAKPDVIHAMWSYEFADAALGTKIPTLITCHDSPWRVGFQTRLFYRFVRALYAQFWVFPRVQYMSTVSPYIINELRRFHGYFRKVVLIPNGIPCDRLNAEPQFDCRGRAKATIVVVSEWGRLKNVVSSIEAFSLIQQEVQSAELVLFGHGLGAGEAAESYCRRKNISTKNMRFLGYQPQEKILSVLREEAAVFLHTSLEESFCMTILEAMAQGVVCVGGKRCGAVPWLLDEGQSGVLVDVKSAKSVAAGVINMLRDGGERERLARAGYRRVQMMFMLDSLADEYLHLLDGIRNCNS